MKKPCFVAIYLLLIANLCVGATLTGKVIDLRGNPVPALRLLIVQKGTGDKTTVVANENGSFTQILKHGEYEIHSVKGERKVPLATIRMAVDQKRHLRIQVGQKGEIHITESLDSSGPAEEDPSLAAIREYQVHTLQNSSTSVPAFRQMAELVNPFPARKEGRFHGALYEFHRNDNLDARNFFDPVEKQLPEYKRNQFGVSLGVAVGSSLNLLGTYDGLRIIQGSTLLSHLPTTAMKRGDFSTLNIALRDPQSGEILAGNKIPGSRISPVAKRLLSLLPDPNQGDPDRNYVNNEPVVGNRDSISMRADYQMKNGSSFFVRYTMANADNFFVNPLPAFGSRYESRSKNLTSSYSKKITNRLLSNWRIEFDRSVDFMSSVNAGKSGLLKSLGISGLAVSDAADEGYPDFRLSGYASFGDSGLPFAATNNRLSFDGSLTFTPQKHTFRLGGGLTANQSNNNRSGGVRKGAFTFNGYYSGDAFADFLLGAPDSATRGHGADRTDLRRKTWYLFAQDEWKPNASLSLSWGMTYNYFQPYYSIVNNVSVFYPLEFEPPIDGEIVIAGTSRATQLGFDAASSGSMIFPDRNDWAPSLGFAYRPLAGNRIVVRSGYSTYYAPLGRDSFVSFLGRNYPFYYIESAVSSIDKADITLDSPFSAAAVTEPSISNIDPHLRTTYVNNWMLSVQGELFHQWHMESSYGGSKATHLVRTMLANVPLPGAGDIQARRPNPKYGRFSILTGSGSYSTNSFNLGAERRLADGVSLKTGFSLTEGMSDLYYGNPSNPRNLRAERSRFNSPARQFYFNYILDLPFGKNGRIGRDLSAWMQPFVGGWRLSGITNLQDGSRFTVTSAGDPNNDGVSDDRPDRLRYSAINSSNRTIDNWFDTTDFASPASYSYGNSGRNILTGPPYVNWDLSIIKQTRIFDGNLVEFRVELFNAFNQVNFQQPSSVFGTSLFGKVFGAHRAREIELALRYSF